MSIQDYVVPLERARELERIVQAYTVPCDKCEGRGHMSGPTTQGPCISCGTSGVIHPYATGLGAWLASRPCRKCRGFAIAYTTPGGDMVNEVCDACHGTGKQSEWPSLVWYRFPEPEYAEAFPKRADWQFDMWESVGHAFMEWRQFSFEAEYVHALTFEQRSRCWRSAQDGVMRSTGYLGRKFIRHIIQTGLTKVA